MRGCAKHRDTKAQPGLGVTGSSAAGNVSSAPGKGSGSSRMSTAATELHHCPALRRQHAASRFGGNDGLESDRRQQIGFHQLSLNQRGTNYKHRLAGKDGGSLGYRENTARKPEVAEKVEKLRVCVLE